MTVKRKTLYRTTQQNDSQSHGSQQNNILTVIFNKDQVKDVKICSALLLCHSAPYCSADCHCEECHSVDCRYSVDY